MRKNKSNYLKPYIRKIKPTDIKSTRCDLRTFVRLSMSDIIGYKYVLVQRGAGILAVDRSKKALKESIFVSKSNKDFNVWCNRIKNRCQKI